MKSHLILLVFSSFIMAAGNAEVLPQVVRADFVKGYVPNGFDTNDKVQLVGEGFFPNSCYRKSSVRVSVNHTLKIVRVTPTAYKYDGMCMQMVIPFDSVVDVGLLRAGTYKIVQGRTNEALGEVTVRASANRGPDDFLYAPVSQAYVSQDADSLKIRLSGQFPDGCMHLDRVQTSVEGNVVVVQPIATRDESLICSQATVPFEHIFELKNVPVGRYLLHVRSLNGNAVNNLFSVN